MQSRRVTKGNSTHILLYKPFQVLCQFSPQEGKRTLADFVSVPDVYPAGRLDYDSEGLVFLTSDGALQQRLTHPRFHHSKTYLVQVEGVLGAEALGQLQQGIVLDGTKTLPCQASIIPPPDLPLREPPIRVRKAIPTSWIKLTLCEGRNRQVRRMTAFVGFPTLRLIRCAIGQLTLSGLTPGQWRSVTEAELQILRSQ